MSQTVREIAIRIANAEPGVYEANYVALAAHVLASPTEPAVEPISRWEVGFRNIVTILIGPRTAFEISDVVESVRDLRAQLQAAGQHYQRLCDSLEVVGGERDTLQREKEAAQQEREEIRAHCIYLDGCLAAEICDTTEAQQLADERGRKVERLQSELNKHTTRLAVVQRLEREVGAVGQERDDYREILHRIAIDYTRHIRQLMQSADKQDREAERLNRQVVTGLTKVTALQQLADERGRKVERLKKLLTRAQLPHSRGCAIAALCPCSCGVDEALATPAATPPEESEDGIFSRARAERDSGGTVPMAEVFAPAAQEHPDTASINWLNEQIVNVIYLDDGRVIDVKGNDIRVALFAARTAPEAQR